MYRDHWKGPGGPPGGPPISEGPMGQSGEGNQPIVGWCAPLGPPMCLGLETLRGGGASTWLGGQATPRASAPSLDGIYKGPAPP